MKQWCECGHAWDEHIPLRPGERGRCGHGSCQCLSYKIAEPETPSADMVNHPPHYTDGQIEHIVYVEDRGWQEGYCLGNATKYIHRAGRKGNKLEDLKKARWYLDRYIAWLERPSDATPTVPAVTALRAGECRSVGCAHAMFVHTAQGGCTMSGCRCTLYQPATG